MVEKRRHQRENYLHPEDDSAGEQPFQQSTRFGCNKIPIPAKNIPEEALHERDERYRTLQENIPVGLYRTTPEGKILTVNPAMVKMFQYESANDLMAVSFSNCYAEPEERQPILDRLKAAGKLEDVEVKFKRKDGTTFWGSLSIIMVTAPDANTIFFDGILQDITERKRVEEERLSREKLQGVLEMAGAVCHELNQPMQSVSGYFELLLMDISKDDPLYGKIDKIKEQIERIGKITAKLMRITKYETKDYLKGKIIDIDKATSRYIAPPK